MKINYLHQESGRSMIEMLGVLAIMGIITVGAITMIAAAMRSQKRTAVQDEVTQIVTGVRGLLGGYDDYSGIDNSIIFAAIGVSNKNPFSGEYTLSMNPADPRQFVLVIGGLSSSDCEYFKTKAWSDSVGYQMSGGKVGGAEAVPTDCNAQSGQNLIRIIYS